MPIIIKNFTWRQTETTVIVQLPLRGVHQSKVDLFTSATYIKASYGQFFFEAFLLHPILCANSKCTLTPTDVLFELIKEENIFWEKLEVDISRKDKLCLKREIIEKEHEALQNDCKQKSEKKCELKREAVRQQISLDTKQRTTIEKIKNDEKVAAIGDLKTWSKNAITPKFDDIPSDDENVIVSNKTEISIKKEKLDVKKKPMKTVIRNKFPPLPKNKTTTIPFPRQSGVVEVDFTARQFPTPSRESQLGEENEWLRKQAEVRRTVGFVSEDLRPEERNPQYLNSKGLEFLKSGNYLGAISAFSFGIKLTEKFSDLYVNRSRAQFEYGNYYKSIQDCSKALELLQPVVSSNFNIRVECILRRGLGLCKMGMLREGVSELESAYKLRPDDDSIKQKLCAAIDQLNEAAAAES